MLLIEVRFVSGRVERYDLDTYRSLPLAALLGSRARLVWR